LEEAIKLLKNNRNSNTSSTPPSHDYGRSNQKSLRKRSGKKSGGQQGHVGSNLELSESPDKTIEYKPQFCKECGEELKGHDFSFVLRKQEVILPPINPVYVEHQSYSCKCGKCGSITISELPPNLKSNIQYGDEIKALVVYLSVYQYLSYNRIAEFLDDFLTLFFSASLIQQKYHKVPVPHDPLTKRSNPFHHW